MDDRTYTDAELERYFRDRDARHRQDGGDGAPEIVPPSPPPAAPPPAAPRPAAPRSEGDDIRERVGRVIRGTLIGLGIFVGLMVLWLAWLSRDLPSTAVIENPKNLLATVVYTDDGEELARYYERENRTWVPLDSISQHVINGLVAIEDRRFHDHWGVDLRGFGAVAVGAASGKGVRGASTITMQLARNLFNEDINFEIGDRSPLRKLKEILTAIRIERIYTKSEIIEAYLNTVAFRYNAYGIESAAQTYFAKHARELAPEEAATLVGMLAANTLFDPKRNPESSQRRRNIVLRAMVNEGFLDEAYYQQVSDEPIALTFKAYSHESNLAPHFAEILRQWFKAWCDANGYDPYADGLVIHTTINSEMQALATAALTEQMDGLQAVVDVEWGAPSARGLGTTAAPYVRRMERGNIDPFGTWWARNPRIVNEYVRGTAAFRTLTDQGVDRDAAIEQLLGDEAFVDSLKTIKTRIEGGLVAMNPQTGRVRAWVGGRNFTADKYDHVGLARRQPGSTFKPFAYTAAFDAGYSPNYYVLDSPFTWNGWRPLNYGGGASGAYVSLRAGLSRSKNIPTARVTQLVQASTVAGIARDLGIRSPLDLTPGDSDDEAEYPNSIGLGVTDVTLLEMATAYSTLANYGVYHGPPDPGNEAFPTTPPYPPQMELAVSRIEDRYGNIVAEFEPYGREVLNPSVAYTTVDVLKDVVSNGTATSLRRRFDVGRIELGGKTGTTQESADGWFIAINPDLVVGAWVGWNDRRIVFRTSTWGQGSRTGLLLVGSFLEKLQNEGSEEIRLDPSHDFDPPPNYRPPSRTGYSGDRRRSSTRSRDPNVTEDRPARDLLRRWREQEQGSEGAGRIGW